MCRHSSLDGFSGGPSVSLDREVLPANVKPLSYDLTLEPNLSTFEYDGQVAIK
jgi:aminopeptidase 2